MTGFLWAALGVLGGFGLAATGDMVSEEVRDRLDHLPHAILRLAARQLEPAHRSTAYGDEWLPELIYILKGDEARPITRLYHGTRYAFGIFLAVRRITGQLGQPSPLTDALARIGAAVIEMQLLIAGIHALEQEAVSSAEQLCRLQCSRVGAYHRIFVQPRIKRHLMGTSRRLAALYLDRERIERNVVDTKMGSSITEVLSRLEAGTAALQTDWTLLARTVGARSKNRNIRRISRIQNFPADFPVWR